LPSASRPIRALALAALVIAAVVVAVVLLDSGGGYTVHARFADAGGLVTGSPVEVSGASIGTVKSIRLSDDNQADLVLSLSDDRYKPLREGTTAKIRTIGLAGVANRFVELTPGPRSNPPIANDGLLGPEKTQGIVDLDVLLDALTPKTRKQLQGFLGNAASIYGGDGAANANRVIRYLNPAVRSGRDLSAEAALDPAADERLILTGAATARALASRRNDLAQGVSHAATTLNAIATRSDQLGDLLARSPSLLARARTTMHGLDDALAQVRPALREARPVAGPAAALLRALPPTARTLTPVIDQIEAMVPAVRATARGLPPLSRQALPAIQSTTTTLQRALPIFTGLREYGPDLVTGLAAGTSASAAVYDANGHMVRMALSEPGNEGLFSPLTKLQAGNLRGQRTGLDARCPGGAYPPAADKSNPYIPDPGLCDPADDQTK
jgi:phospholipid/cholesterol/gamma-HCH transport system substrate-binding protein